MTFSEKAKPLKAKSNLTLHDISIECNISESMASRYINGEVEPPQDIAEKILIILGYDDKPHDDNAFIKDMYEERLSDMRKVIGSLRESNARERRERWIMFIILMAVIAFIILVLMIDVANGGVGWFNY